jgi:hypothetical protein
LVLPLSDGARTHVAHPDLAAVSPGPIAALDSKTQGLALIDPSHVVAIEELARSRPNGKRSR